MKRNLVIALGAVMLICGVGIALLSGHVDSYRPKIQAELQDKLKRTVTLGHLGLKLFPLSIEIDGFSLGDDPAFGSGQPFAAASKVYVSAGLFSLLTGNPQVEDVILDQPQIELIRNAKGQWNFASLGGGSSSSGANNKFTLDKLEIKDGKVALTDVLHQQARAIYDHIALKVMDFAPNKQFEVDLGLNLPGEGKQLAEFKGKVGALSSGAALPQVVGHLSLEEVSVGAVNRLAAGALPANTDAVASGGTDINTTGGKISAKGDLKLDKTVIHGAKLDYPIQAKYEVEADQGFDHITIKSAKVSLGPTSFETAGSIDNSAKPPMLDVQLKTSDSSLTELAKLAGSLGMGFSPKYKIDGRLTVDASAKGPISTPQLSGKVSLKNVSASGGEIKDPVSTPELDLRLTPQSIVSNTFTAKSGSTSLDASFTLTNYDSKDPVADVTLRSSNAQVAELLNIARAYGVAAAEEVTGSGTLSVDVHAHGETSHPELLTYAGTASLQQATVSVPQLTKPVTVHSVNAQFSQNSVALTNLSATVGGSTLSGTLSAANFSAPNLNFALAADKIDTDELQKLMAPTKTKGRVAPVAAGQNEPTLLTVTTGGGTLSVNSIKAQDIVITAVSAKVTLDHGLITLSPLSAAAFNGKINGAVAADMRPKTPLCSLDAKLAGVDANALLSAVSTLKNELYGTLGATTKMKFALASSNDLARTLNGTVDFALSNGELKNVNILGEISKFGKLLGGSSGQGSGGETALKQLSGTMTIADGVATTNNLKAATSDGAVTAKGTLNLVTQAIDMHMTALAIPVLVTGTTAHMKFAPDAKALAKDIPGALEGILGGKNSNGKQTNPLGGILGGFGKKQQ